MESNPAVLNNCAKKSEAKLLYSDVKGLLWQKLDCSCYQQGIRFKGQLPFHIRPCRFGPFFPLMVKTISVSLLLHRFPTLCSLISLHLLQLQPLHILVSCSLWFLCITPPTSISFLTFSVFILPHAPPCSPHRMSYSLTPSPTLVSPISLASSLTPSFQRASTFPFTLLLPVCLSLSLSFSSTFVYISVSIMLPLVRRED